jgi:hypothetical protein
MNKNLKQPLKSILLFLILFHTYFISAQISYSNYTTLKAIGAIPEVFKISTTEKIALGKDKTRENLNETDARTLNENIHYSIDGLLQSGLVLYGDPVTEYVQKVAEKLLANSPELRSELKFFTLKSNVTNALSTDQGIIFVTLGLLAQIENEAQLAYILSHEIAHYQKKHVEEFFKNKISANRVNSQEKRITILSNHSKDHEIEADIHGIKLYHEAGYSKEDLFRTFSVLMYSYLPFDETKLPTTYFNTPQIQVPEKFFPEIINPISAEENYDDEKSSHPNIKKRKNAIHLEAAKYENWGNLSFNFSENEFFEIRNIARFEGIHLDLISCNYGDALYSVFLLEKDFPNNVYLERCKSKAWLGLATFKVYNQFSKAILSPKDAEGEIYAMHFFLNKLSKNQITTLALREIFDTKEQYPKDKEIEAIYERMVKLLAENHSFSLSDYKKKTYEVALQEFEVKRSEFVQDSIFTDSVRNANQETLSKYDKINQKKTKEFDLVNPSTEPDLFHLYGLSDLVENINFLICYNKYKSEQLLAKTIEDSIKTLKLRQRRKYYESLISNEEELIYIDPSFSTFYYSYIHLKESAETKDLISKNVLTFADKFNIKIHDLSLLNIEQHTTDMYNQRLLLMNYLQQRGQYESISHMFPVDFTELQLLQQNFNNAPILFVFGEYNYRRKVRETSLSFLLINTSTGNVQNVETTFFKNPKKLYVEGYVYNAISKINSKKRKKKDE